MIKADKDIHFDDIEAIFFLSATSAPPTAQASLIPLDGDFLMVSTAPTFCQKPMDPRKTWDDYLKVANAVNGMDMAGDTRNPATVPASPKARSQAVYWWLCQLPPPTCKPRATSRFIL